MGLRDYLRRARRRVSLKIRRRLNALAKESPIMRQMVLNLEAESHLRKSDWEALVTALDNAPRGRKATEQTIRAWCRSGRSLKGRTATVPAGTVYGRAVKVDGFASLMKELGYQPTVPAARAELRTLVGLDPTLLPSRCRNYDMGKHLMWSTFHETEPLHPFGSPLPTAMDILCMLGLTPEVDLVLLLQYCLPPHAPPRIPTVCDAYAAPFWSPYFRPGLRREPFGTTVPTDPTGQQGKPEVVHEVIEMGTLVEPPRYAP